MQRRRGWHWMILALFALMGAACNMPERGRPTESAAGLIYTAAAETVRAQLTQVNQPPSTGGETPVPPQNLGGTPVPSIQPSATPEPTGVQTTAAAEAGPCDRAEFDQDVTYPDHSQVPPGAAFVKTWRLRNTGSCTWTSAYAAVFTGGDALASTSPVQLGGEVPPGSTVDISVTMTAPATGGSYRGEWKLRNATGQIFGLGSQGDKPFWVVVEVAGATAAGYDFVARAPEAAWASGAGSLRDSPLTFGGGDDDPNGVARLKEAILLETGATSGKLILTFPKHVDRGLVGGLFPPYTVRRGDRFKARLGFLLLEEKCGAGNVIFQLKYQEGGKEHFLAEWTKRCDGRLLPVELDLSGLAGRTVEFLLIVKANGPFQDDWAIWNSPRVEP